MNQAYLNSGELLKVINSSNKILLNLHRNPDADSLGSAVSMYAFLKHLGKEVEIASPSEVPEHLLFLLNGVSVDVVEFDDMDFSRYDLFIVMDTSTWPRIFSSTHFKEPEIHVVVIDNHVTNKGFGTINLLDYETSSVTEMVFKLFKAWNFSVDNSVAQALLAGIVGDTGSFQYEVYADTLGIAQELVNKGANLLEINLHLYNTVPLELIKFWGLVIYSMKVDDSGFVYSAIPYSEYSPFSHLKGTRETASSMIIKKVAGTRFGFVMTEDEPNVFSVSFRSREDVDISKIASSLGGGGHPGAAGAYFNAESFGAALERILSLCKEI